MKYIDVRTYINKSSDLAELARIIMFAENRIKNIKIKNNPDEYPDDGKEYVWSEYKGLWEEFVEE